MIQEAHVGLGVYGKEGRNAARSADFAIGKFKFIKRILLVHGYLYYTRTAFVVNYSFYIVCILELSFLSFFFEFIVFSKALTFVMSQFYFGFFSAFSIQVCTLFKILLGYIKLLILYYMYHRACTSHFF